MIVAVCGLHGGAGTTTLALLLADAAAAQRHGRVLVCDTSPTAGGLALAARAASAYNLADVARLTAAGRRPTQVPWADLPAGTRLMARAPGRRAAAPASAIATVLTDAAAAHDLVVIDAGQIADDHATAALRAADVVLWTLDATAQLTRCAHLLAGELSTPARDATWLLAASATGRHGQPAAAAQLAELVPTASRLTFVPVIGQLPNDDPARVLVGAQLLSQLA
jgi:Flp pilus assembly CpaE family ATPase